MFLFFLFALLFGKQKLKEEFEDNEDITGYMKELLNKIKHCGKIALKQEKELEKLNIIVLGKTGVGKSTLINHIFRDFFAETGVGRPVTKLIQKITEHGLLIQLMEQKVLLNKVLMQ